MRSSFVWSRRSIIPRGIIESACSLFCQYTIGTLFRPLAKSKKTKSKPTAPFPTRSTRASSYSRQNSEECNVFRVFLLSLYKVIELNEFDKIIVMFLRSAASRLTLSLHSTVNVAVNRQTRREPSTSDKIPDATLASPNCKISFKTQLSPSF